MLASQGVKNMINNPLDILYSFANSEDTYYLPEVLSAIEEIESPIDDGLMVKLKKLLETETGRNRPETLLVLLLACQKATTDKLKIDCLASVVSYDRHQLNYTYAEQCIQAKKDAIKYLEIHNSNKALEAIASGLSQLRVSSDASMVLVKSEYGINLLLDYIKSSNNPNPDAVDVLLNNETEQVVKVFLDLLDENVTMAKKLVSHQNESIRIKANQIMSLQQEATMESNKDIEYKLEIPREVVRLINLLKKEPVLAAIKGRKKIKFPHRTFREKADRSASFKCPFCSESNEVNGHNCKHVVYGYETVNYLVVCVNEDFLDVIIKLISSDPTYYVEDLEYFLEEYLDTLDFMDGEKVEIDLKAYKIVLKDRISPDVLESVINKNGIPIMMKSLLEYSLYSDYIGGGTYYYLVSDDDLINLATYQARQ